MDQNEFITKFQFIFQKYTLFVGYVRSRIIGLPAILFRIRALRVVPPLFQANFSAISLCLLTVYYI